MYIYFKNEISPNARIEYFSEFLKVGDFCIAVYIYKKKLTYDT